MAAPPVFDTEKAPARLSIRMSATLEAIDRADETVSAFLEQSGAAVDLFAMRILLREAVLNAVTHGSGTDPSRTVELTVELDERSAVLTVRDSGPGFVWQARGTEFDITGDGGRGLALMQIYASEMTYSDKGNHVVLRRDHETAAMTPTN